MIPIKNSLLAFAVTVTASLVGLSSASAQDYTQGDLVLFFQNPAGIQGSNQSVFASLGNTATVFRNNSAISSTPTNQLNIVNIGTTLTAAYGSNWASETTLWGGLGGVWGNSPNINNSTLENGDPHRTIYTSVARSTVGTVGTADSGIPNYNTDGIITTTVNSMITQYGDFAALPLTTVAQITDTTRVPAQNPAGGNGWNSSISGGVQQQGSAGNFGTFLTVNNVQFMWDIYRFTARNNIANQFDSPVISGTDPTRTGQFLGTVVLNSAGDVSFVAVPEPSTYMMLGLGALLIAFGVRRRRASRA